MNITVTNWCPNCSHPGCLFCGSCPQVWSTTASSRYCCHCGPEGQRLKTRIIYNTYGQPLTLTDPLGNATASHQAVYAAATSGETAAARWDALWRKLQ